MMRYTRFEELPVWQLAVNLYERSRALELRKVTGEMVMQNELERVALGISTEIAQSFGREEKASIIGHVANAGSFAAGLRSLISILQQRENSPELTIQLSELRDGAESCSRQLRAWSDVIRISDLEEKETVPPRPSAERLAKLMENLPSRHSLRADPAP